MALLCAALPRHRTLSCIKPDHEGENLPPAVALKPAWRSSSVQTKEFHPGYGEHNEASILPFGSATTQPNIGMARKGFVVDPPPLLGRDVPAVGVNQEDWSLCRDHYRTRWWMPPG